MVSKRVEEIPPSGIRKFFDLVQASEDLVSLGVGEPDFPTPEPIKDKAIRAIEEDYSSYTSNYGIPELRKEIASKLHEANGIKVDSEAGVVITTGTSEALDLTFRALLNPGDEVIIPEPSYVCYYPGVYLAYATPVPVPTKEEEDFTFKADAINEKITKKTKVILVATPNNPTGSVVPQRELKGIAELAVEHNLLVISDEIYEELVYDDHKHVSIGSLPGMAERTITINGYSKSYAATGWRLGYAAGPKGLIDPIVKIHQYSMLCAPTISQYALLGAFKLKSHVKSMLKEYDQRRRLLVKGLNELKGVSCFTPKGAFYTFPNITKTGLTSEEFAERLLKENGVAVVPGTAFGPSGEGYIRCSYSVSRDTIKVALKRMKEFTDNL
ncbi:MAG: pyridoxal phosphate-dependent aminotransferase [Candidatus Altiarchaeota archaeon]